MELGIGVGGIVKILGQICRGGFAADQVAKVLGSFGLPRLYDGEYSTQDGSLVVEFLGGFLGCCTPALIRIAIINTRTVPQLTRLTGIGLVTLGRSQC